MDSVDVRSLINRLERIDERGTALQVIKDFKKNLSAATSWQVEHLVQALFSSVRILSKYLTSSEITSQLNDVFNLVEPGSRILIFNSLFISGVEEVYMYLMSSLRLEYLVQILRNSIDEESKEYDELITCLVVLPDKLSNFSVKLKSNYRCIIVNWLGDFSVSLIKALQASMTYAYNRISCGQNVCMKTVSLLLTKGRNITVEENDTLLSRVTCWICRQESSPLWDRIAQRVFTDDTHGIREFDALTAGVIQSAFNGDNLIRCFGYSIKKEVVLLIVRRFLLQRVCEYRVSHSLIDFIAETGGKDIFLNLFQSVILIWTDPSFIQFNADDKQRYLTISLLHFGRKVNDIGLHSYWSSFSTSIVNGVHLRLGSSDPTIRSTGLFVGEMCSKWKGDAEPLKFDYEKDDWIEQMSRAASGIYLEKPKLIIEEELKPPLNFSIPKLPDIKVNEEFDSDDEVEFEGDYIPEEEKYFDKIKEGEDIEKYHAQPNYIIDAMEWLGEKEQYEKFEASFYNLESMIRRNAVGFKDVATKLVLRLVNLENNFSSKNFESVRKACVIACLVTKPELAPAIGEIVFTRSSCFLTRYLILECLLEAAKELSELPKAEPSFIQDKIERKTAKENDWRSIVDARIKAKTRIISKKKFVEPTYVNRFSPVASLFFYPLLRTQTEDHLQLRGKDAPFLARVLVTAAEILQCASSSVNIVKLASSLISLVTPLRFHEEPSLRIAVLFSYFSVISIIPSRVLFTIFCNEIQSWIEWTCSVADNVDISEQEKTLANHLTALMLEKGKEVQGLK